MREAPGAGTSGNLPFTRHDTVDRLPAVTAPTLVPGRRLPARGRRLMEQCRLRVRRGRGGIGGVKDPFGCDEPALLARPGTADRDAARRAVASRAADGADLGVLLDMLGLRPGDDPPATPPRCRDRGRSRP
ncbi:hypothetical protein [Streptomyces bambusae]|uniref:Uncharacterized protein n=1 Tax=Streptomyces bambusae TaxID=1550616 RepID=A0ABS6Z418_9ACTN|nr:hypothetical protein [Streptomyces bambusae]MBW5482494.1 hypothetical protein [Streptomyces bambusae]